MNVEGQDPPFPFEKILENHLEPSLLRFLSTNFGLVLFWRLPLGRLIFNVKICRSNYCGCSTIRCPNFLKENKSQSLGTMHLLFVFAFVIYLFYWSLSEGISCLSPNICVNYDIRTVELFYGINQNGKNMGNVMILRMIRQQKIVKIKNNS